VNTFFGRDGFCRFALTEKKQKQKQKLEQEQKEKQSVKNVFVFCQEVCLTCCWDAEHS
jgi:hypothetical protein